MPNPPVTTTDVPAEIGGMPAAPAAATVLGYYLAADLVTGPWKRRVVRALVLAAGAGVAVGMQKSRQPAATPADPAAATAAAAASPGWQGEEGKAGAAASPDPAAGHIAGTATGHGETHGQRGQFTGRNAGVAALGTAALVAGTWLSTRIDRAGARAVARFGGKLPLVGRLLRRFPNAGWGVLQLGAVAAAPALQARIDSVTAPTSNPQFR